MRDLVIVPERQEPTTLVLAALPGHPLHGKTKVLNHLHLVNGCLRLKCQPRERAGLIRYFKRAYQLVEIVDGPSEVGSAPVEHENAEVSGDVQPKRGRPRKSADPVVVGDTDSEAGD